MASTAVAASHGGRAQNSLKSAVNCRRQEAGLNSVDLILVLHMLVIAGFGLRIISRQPPAGVAFAWLALVSMVPAAGVIAYLLVGEKRVGAARLQRMAEGRVLRASLQPVPASLSEDHEGLRHLALTRTGSPAVAAEATAVLTRFDDIIDAMLADIRGARRLVLIETYIWSSAGRIGEIEDALLAAAARGVECRILADALGSRGWLRSEAAARLRAGGVRITPALPINWWSGLFGRADLRLHRKIMAVDGESAWAGSMNMVDPRLFKQDAGVGQWHDAMVRFEGPIAMSLAATVIVDLLHEGERELPDLGPYDKQRRIKGGHSLTAQAIATGPGMLGDGLQLMLLSLIGMARRRLVMTTPYFAPDEILFQALRAAAGRGVKVTLILPRKVDSLLTRFACQSYFAGLLEAGIEIAQFDGGLLHTKSIVVDGRTCMFGSVNLDFRSLWLNYEIALFIYGESLAQSLGAMQDDYLKQCRLLQQAEWQARPAARRLIENLFRLLSPLL